METNGNEPVIKYFALAILIIFLLLVFVYLFYFGTNRLFGDSHDASSSTNVSLAAQTFGCLATPLFGNFLATSTYEKEPHTIDFSTATGSSRFYTMITRGVTRNGVNMGGRYSLVSWGCGTACQEHAIVDTENGRIVNFGLVSAYGIRTRADSNLLIFNPKEPGESYGTSTPQTVTKYYKFTGTSLKFICQERF